MVEEEAAQNSSVQELQKKIDAKSEAVESLTERLYVYQENIDAKQNEKFDLQNQLAVLEDKAEETKTEIEKSGIELDVLQLEIEALQHQIRDAENDIQGKKGDLAAAIQDLYAYQQKTPLEIAFSQQSLSEFFTSVEYTSALQKNIHATVDKIQNIKGLLEGRRTEVKDKKAEVSQKKTELELQQVELEGEQQVKDTLLADTEESEEKFQELLQKAQEEQAQLEEQVSSLQKSAQAKIDLIRADIQQKLEDNDSSNDSDISQGDKDFANGIVSLAWPIDSRTITCGFHCGGNPFRNIVGEHSGMDLATPYGTEVRAAASGYVTVAKFDGTSNLAYVSIAHGDDLLTMYLHLSAVYVSYDQYVHQGDVIGLSGGIPGTPGAGAFSTGAHLHFEVRVSGTPTDPLSFLP